MGKRFIILGILTSILTLLTPVVLPALPLNSDEYSGDSIITGTRDLLNSYISRFKVPIKPPEAMDNQINNVVFQDMINHYLNSNTNNRDITLIDLREKMNFDAFEIHDLFLPIIQFDNLINNRIPGTSSAPEPGTMLLLGIGLISIAGLRKNISKR